jgi:hypothetical protein
MPRPLAALPPHHLHRPAAQWGNRLNGWFRIHPCCRAPQPPAALPASGESTCADERAALVWFALVTGE